MLYTSYMGNLKNIKEKKIAIMRFLPDWSKPYIDSNYIKLAPSKDLLTKYKDKIVNYEEFKLKYLEEIKDIDIKKLYKKFKNTTLLCTCKPGIGCHRHILAEHLINNGYMVKEKDIDRVLKNIKVKIFKKVTPNTVNKNKDIYFLYTDSLLKEKKNHFRDLDNTLPITIKRSDKNVYNRFLNDSEYHSSILEKDVYMVLLKAIQGYVIGISEDFFNTDLKDLRDHAPLLYIMVYTRIRNKIENKKIY